jgi:hypothetical protein
MKRFVEGIDRGQATLLLECRADWIDENNPVRVIDIFVDELDLSALGFEGVAPELTGRPSYHPSMLLKLYIYGYLNRVQSSRRLEREAGRNVEVTGDGRGAAARRGSGLRKLAAPLRVPKSYCLSVGAARRPPCGRKRSGLSRSV